MLSVPIGTQEDWRPIPGWPDYDVSNLGRVISRMRRTPVLLKTRTLPMGYHKVALTRDGVVTDLTVHRAVMLAFVGPCPDGLQVRHLDGDPANNALSNLAYGTASQNMRDVVRHGRHHQVNKTHCPKDHPYDEANTWLGDHGQRRCRACHRAAQTAYMHRRRTA